MANPGADSGMDSDKGTYVFGGNVVALGATMDWATNDSSVAYDQAIMNLQFSSSKSAGDAIIITDSNVAKRDNIIAAIEGRYYVTLFYDDESGEGCTGARTVQVCAYGYHTGTGNKCFRAYEWFGATHTEVPAWKMFLTKRCRSFRLMTEADRWTSVPPLYHMNDAQMETILWQVDDTFIPQQA